MAEANVAIALSRGGAEKRYPHSEPNEDAAGFALGGAGAFIAVADGHGGFEASEVTLELLLGGAAAQWTEAPAGLDAEGFRRQALAALFDANRAVRRESGTRSPRTTSPSASCSAIRPASCMPPSATATCSSPSAEGVREVAPASETRRLPRQRGSRAPRRWHRWRASARSRSQGCARWCS